MAKKNDNVILALTRQIDEKKRALKAADKFVPVTNCSIELDGQRQNIHTLNKDGLVLWLVKLNALKMSAENLGLLSQYRVGGYLLSEWIQDIQTKLTIATRKEEEARLKELESRLHSLLSVDKKVELELDELKSLI